MNRSRTRLPRDRAQKEYVRAGELEVFRQLERDARELDRALPAAAPLALGPFARVQAGAVVDELGKTRGAINHLWRSQEAFRASIMADFLNDESLGMEDLAFPNPAQCRNFDDWIRRLAALEIERGPRHGAAPGPSYGFRWAAWLGLVPYGLWSEHVARASLVEFRRRVDRFSTAVIQPALEHFGLRLRRDVTLQDLVVSFVSLVEGVWLNACLTADDPIGRSQSIGDMLGRAMTLLFRGALEEETTPRRLAPARRIPRRRSRPRAG